ncbi:MAG TPA: hypothetical protein VF681_08535 [Abditibacteriaceae bacterium]|jgi:hypothetical protein
MKKTLLTVGLGAAAMYLFDPELGEVRRSYLRDKLRGVAPKTSDAIHEKKEALAASAHDLTERADAAAAEKIDAIPVENLSGEGAQNDSAQSDSAGDENSDDSQNNA